jgi:hypothetical protein
MKKTFLVIIVLFSILSLISCLGTKKNNYTKEMKKLTNIVYSMVKEDKTTKKEIKQHNKKSSDSTTSYKYLEVTNAYEFELELDAPMIFF